MSDIGPFEFGTTDAVKVRFVAQERPHGDELTLVSVELRSGGLDACSTVESLAGDYGVKAEPVRQRGDVTEYEDIRLSDFLIELSTAPHAWVGSRGWRSLANELCVDASCDSLGHVTLAFTLQPRPWEPSWSATARLRYPLGNLNEVGRELGSWFEAQWRVMASPSALPPASRVAQNAIAPAADLARCSVPDRQV